MSSGDSADTMAKVTLPVVAMLREQARGNGAHLSYTGQIQLNATICVSTLRYWFPVAQEEILDDLKQGLRLSGMPE